MTAPSRIGVIGCTGRMGRLVVDELLSGEWGPDVRLAGGMARMVDLHADTRSDHFVTDDAEKLFTMSDIIIDFTQPEATAKHASLTSLHRKPYISGTTGLNDEQHQALADAARNGPVLYAANMSVGVTLLAALVEQAAAKLGPEWDIEILETHHHNKVDAPSGTALLLGRATGREALPGDRNGKRPPGSVGYAVRRGGDVVGEHAVTFYGMGERIEMTHIATDRRLFARGAIKAALWTARQPPGLYSIRDALGL